MPIKNLAEVISPLAVAGSELNNKILMEYDERNLLLRTTRSPSTTDAIVKTYNYDLNGNRSEVVHEEDPNGTSQDEKTQFFYDGFDRLVHMIDPVGNEHKVNYDPASNVIANEYFGLIGGATRTDNSTAGNELLAKQHIHYDELSRVFKQQAELFMTNGVTTTRPVELVEGDEVDNDNRVTSFVDYDRNSQVVFATSASPTTAEEVSQIEYDGLGRVIRATDPEGNSIESQYDANSNVISMARIDVNPSARVVDETFTTINQYDSLNRLIRTTNNIGQTHRFIYDSRNLLIETTDAIGSLITDPDSLFAGDINDDGNLTTMVHDGLGRLVETVRELRVDGQGQNVIDTSNTANSDGLIKETTTWDENSRQISVTDDKGNTTTYSYDELNRLVQTTFADQKSTSVVYDDNKPIEITDNNGNIITLEYDIIDRLTKKTIQPSTANGIAGTTEQTFEYDGLSRLTKATDNNDPNNTSDDSTVERKYDSLSRLVEEVQNGKIISTNWREAADIANLTYPNGRKIVYTLDKLNRLSTIADDGASSNIASYDYIGNRLLEKLNGNGTRVTMLNDQGDVNEGYDDLGRLVQMRHIKTSNNSVISGYQYGYNRQNIPTHKQNLIFTKFSEVYKYDSKYRLTKFKRGSLTAAKDDVFNYSLEDERTWQLDGVGNWQQQVVNSDTNDQVSNDMNEYDQFNSQTRTHDDNGNRTTDDDFNYIYDFQNRIIEVQNKSDSSLVAKYQYDYQNRRVAKTFLQQTQSDIGGTEYTTDANTIALYHFNNTSGDLIDSSGNDNHANDDNDITRGVTGQFSTNAIQIFDGASVSTTASTSLDSISNGLTLEFLVKIEDLAFDSSVIKT